jgi:uncharacterized membrane protein
MPEIKTALTRPPRGLAAAGALAVAAAAGLMWRLPTPNLSLILEASPAIKIHIVAALAALGIGTALMLGRKGDRLHRTLGWSWVVMMGTTAFASLFIRQINGGHFSLIHLLSGWTLVSLPLGVLFARRHAVRLHRRTMTGIYVGGLIIAGAFTFVPGRLMWQVFFG